MKRFTSSILILCSIVIAAEAQTTEFTYQGNLKTGTAPNTVPANGDYDFEFRLYDQDDDSQVGPTLTRNTVRVDAGAFSVKLDFGAHFPGADRWLGISVRPTGGGAFTPLNPHQKISSTPYAVHSANVAVGGVPPGSSHYIWNTTSTQQNTNFRIGGNGTIGGVLRVDGFPGATGASFGAGDFAVDGSGGVTGGRFMILQTGQVGIGTASPAFKLDVADRIRIKQKPDYSGSNNSAGIWFFQNTPGDRAFVGMENDNSVGFYGNNGGGWGIAMNTATGVVTLRNLGLAGLTQLCRSALGEIASCSSSLKYKTNVGAFTDGISFVNRLRPISFDWKADGTKDVGLGAENVAEIDPRFVTYNKNGEVEGVKYDRITVVLVNAMKEQQAQIENMQNENNEQRRQIETLTELACSLKPEAPVCRQKKEVRR